MAAFLAGAEPAGVTFQSGAGQTSLVELYSSEGCSSCPPAEAWLSKLKDSPGLWQDFVPVAFHVDYWDYLGWRDPWAQAAFSERQRTYAANWHSENVYTPGFVLNGAEWREWPGGRHGLEPSGVKAGVLKVNSTDTNHWQVSFAPATASGGDYEVHAALLAGGLISEVKRGENRGRKLTHDFAVLTFLSAPLIRNGDRAQGEFVLPAQKNVTGSLALAVWVTRAGSMEPLQATGGWLARSAAIQ